MRKSMYILGLIAIIVVVSLISYSFISAEPTWKIYGNKINYSNQYSRIEVTPHTSTTPTRHCFEPEITSYFGENVNLSVALVFNYTMTIDEVWMWNTWLETIYCEYSANATCKSPCNETYNSSHCRLIYEKGSYTNITNKLKHQEHEGEHYYYIKTKKKDTYDTEKTIWCFNTPSNKPNGKLGVFVKNADDSIGKALEQNTYTLIDPFWYAKVEGKECNICGEKLACWDDRDGTAYNRAPEWKCTCRSGESCVEYNLYTETEGYRHEDFKEIDIEIY